MQITGTTHIYSSAAAPADDNNNNNINLTLPSTDSKKQKSRMRKSTSEKKKKASTYREMTFEELLAAKNVHMAQNNYASAIKYLDQMIKLCNDATIIAQLWIEVADLLVLDKEYAKAAQRYAEYAILYPGGEHIEYALFKAIECSFECTLSNDRDQTKTEETLALAESFLQQDHFTQYTDQVRIVRDQCYSKLVESEMSICSFYIKRGQVKQAEKRLEALRTAWLSKVPHAEQSIVLLEQELLIQKELVEQKNHKATQLTHNDKQKHMAERF